VELQTICTDLLCGLTSSYVKTWCSHIVPDLEREILNLLPCLELQLSQLICKQSFNSVTTQLAIAYLQIHPNFTAALSLVKKILNRESSLAAEDKAVLNFHIGKKFNDYPQAYHISDKYFATAAKYYLETDNQLGPLMVQLLTLSRPNQGPLHVRDKLVSLSETLLLSKYRTLNWSAIVMLGFLNVSLARGIYGHGAGYFEANAGMNIAYQLGWKLLWSCLAGVPTMRSVQATGPLTALRNSAAELQQARMVESKMIVPIPYLKSRMYSKLALVEAQPWRKLHYAALALRYARLCGSRDQISETTRIYLVYMKTFSMGDQAPWSEGGRRLRAAFMLLIDKDDDFHLDKQQFQNYAELLSVLTTNYRPNLTPQSTFIQIGNGDAIDPILRAEVDESINDSLARAQILGERLGEDENEPHKYQGEINALRALVLSARVDPDYEASITALQHALDTFSKDGKEAFRIPHTLFRIGLNYFQWFTLVRCRNPLSLPRLDLLNKADEHFSAATEKFQQLRAYMAAALAEQSRVRCLISALRLGNTEDPVVGHVEECLRSLENAAYFLTQRRLEVSAYKGTPESIIEKQHIRSDDKNICDTAITLCLRYSRIEFAWHWVQQSKARSLTDMFELGNMIPRNLQERIASTNDGMELLGREKELVRKLTGNVNRTISSGGFEDLDNLRREMMNNPALAELQALREGKAENVQALEWLFEDDRMIRGGPLCVVDWICITDSTKSFMGIPINKIFISILDHERKLHIEETPLTPHDIEKWGSENPRLDPYGNEDDSPLRELDKLVAQLDRVKRGTTLILSPSGPLHSIPLHALRLPTGELLIEQYPVVYVANLSILRQCKVIRANSRLETPEPNDGRQLTTIGVYEGAVSADEQCAIQTEHQNYIEMFGGYSAQNAEVNCKVFRDAAEAATILHFHGHADKSETDNILDQALRLSERKTEALQTELLTHGAFSSTTLAISKLNIPGEIAEDATPHKITSSAMHQSNMTIEDSWEDGESGLVFERIPEYEYFTVRDVFDLKLKSRLVVLIACESGQVDLLPGEEPLGFLSAFLVAGAESVLGTLRRVASASGRAFSNEFYAEIYRQCCSPVDGMIDLAKALQTAVLKMRQNPETSAPYHWAPFVLHGSWRIRPIEVHQTPQNGKGSTECPGI